MLPFWVSAWWALVALALAERRARSAAARRHKIVVFEPRVAPEDYPRLVQGFGGRIVRSLPIADAVVAVLPSEEAKVKLLARRPEVSSVEEDSSVALCGAEPQKNDEIPWGVARVEAPDSWSYATGDGVKVGVIDTGADLGHPDLRPNLRGGVNLVRRGRPPWDDAGHGTHVTGIIAAAKNGLGVVGVAPRAHLYAVKAFDAWGYGRLSAVLEGLQWCVEQKMQVINLSFGMTRESLALARAVGKAYAAGVVMVAAAGNLGRPDSVVFPARYPEVIAVSALSRYGKLAAFSSFGPEVDLIAPGEEILSTSLRGYRRMSGTSMAAPHVSGIVALCLELRRMEPKEVRQLLLSHCVPLPGLTREQQGHGLPSAARTLGTVARRSAGRLAS
jgi:subtilisin